MLNFVSFFVSLLLPLASFSSHIISLELCLDANADVFFFPSWSAITVSNSPYAFSDLLYFWYRGDLLVVDSPWCDTLLCLITNHTSSICVT